MRPEFHIPTWLQTLLLQAQEGSGVAIPLHAVLRAAFRSGDRAVPLLQDWKRIEGFRLSHRRRGDVASIVIPVRGAHDALRLCLRCVKAHTEGGAAEIVIVAQDSEVSDIQDMLRALTFDESEVRVVRAGATPLGFPAACNLGAREARGHHMVFLNSDAFVGPGWLPKLLAPLMPVDGVIRHSASGPMGTNVSGHQDCGTPIGIDYSQLTPFSVGLFAPDDIARRAPYPARRLVGFCLAVDTFSFEEVGGWFEDWPCPVGMADDDELCLRLTLNGGPQACVVVPDLLVLHQGHASFKELPDAERTFNEALSKNVAFFQRRWSWLLGDWNEWLNREGVK